MLDCSSQIQYFITAPERLSDPQWLIHAMKSISGPCDLVGCGAAEPLCAAAAAASWLIDSGATGGALGCPYCPEQMSFASDERRRGADRSIGVKYERCCCLMGWADPVEPSSSL